MLGWLSSAGHEEKGGPHGAQLRPWGRRNLWALNVRTHETHDGLEEKCWDGYHQQGMKKKGDRMVPNCVPGVDEGYGRYWCSTDKRWKERQGPKQPRHHNESVGSACPYCGGELVSEDQLAEKKDACYYKVRSRYKVWPSAYASGALVQCRKKGAKNWGKSHAEESVNENFADGKGPGRPGDSQRHGIPKNATMAELEKAARAPGRKGQLARWQLNMRRGKKKH